MLILAPWWLACSALVKGRGAAFSAQKLLRAVGVAAGVCLRNLESPAFVATDDPEVCFYQAAGASVF